MPGGDTPSIPRFRRDIRDADDPNIAPEGEEAG